MDYSRKILANQAYRLYKARHYWRRSVRDKYPKEIENTYFGQWVEANNSFQSSKQIYYELCGKHSKTKTE